MKAITLIQPWASGMVAGAKTIETRSWRTKHRGPLAIHASSKAGDVTALNRLHGYLPAPTRCPSGAILCVVDVLDCVKMTEANLLDEAHAEWGLSLQEWRREREWGDFRPGRYGWLTRQLVTLGRPIPARGALSLWEWEPPVDVATALAAALCVGREQLPVFANTGGQA